MVAPSREILGGQYVQAAALLEGLRADGWEATLLPINPRFPRGLRGLRKVRYLRTVLNEALYLASLPAVAKADVVHVFAAAYWAFLLAAAPALLAGRLAGKRVILHYHSGEADDHLSRWGRALDPWLSLAHVIVVPSEYLREVFENYGWPTRVIPNVVDAGRFQWRERSTLAPRFLSNRNLEPHYRVGDTIDAFAEIAARVPGATLVVAGDGSQRAELRARARGLEGVSFLGRVEPEAMPALYAAADVFLNASVIDNQPLSILEAFACGLPVVSTPTGEIARMVRDGETGLLVPPRDPRAIADAAIRLLADPALAISISRRAREQLSRYSWTGVRGQWNEVYAS
ncbi:MAG TPA: glycosyltransferase family 4 protein [bacterium]|nr:glycosyltransferase family 4 protein [bacterium]